MRWTKGAQVTGLGAAARPTPAARATQAHGPGSLPLSRLLPSALVRISSVTLKPPLEAPLKPPSKTLEGGLKGELKGHPLKEVLRRGLKPPFARRHGAHTAEFNRRNEINARFQRIEVLISVLNRTLMDRLEFDGLPQVKVIVCSSLCSRSPHCWRCKAERVH